MRQRTAFNYWLTWAWSVQGELLWPVLAHSAACTIPSGLLILNRLSNFQLISWKCSLDDPLPKLLKLFCSAEQNGHQKYKYKECLNSIQFFSLTTCGILEWNFTKVALPVKARQNNMATRANNRRILKQHSLIACRIFE